MTYPDNDDKASILDEFSEEAKQVVSPSELLAMEDNLNTLSILMQETFTPETSEQSMNNLNAAALLASSTRTIGALIAAQSQIDMAGGMTIEAASYKHKAQTDELTGIPNLSAYNNMIKRAIEISGKKEKDTQPEIDNEQRGLDLSDDEQQRLYSALVLLDLDRFKGINDLYGHVTGDKMLQEFTNDVNKALTLLADTLTENTRSSDIGFARIGGDEFALVLETLAPDPEEAKEHFDKALERIREPLSALHLKHDDKCFPIVSSVGMHVIKPNDTPETAKMHADISLYEDKQTKHARYEYAITQLREAGVIPIEVEDVRGAENQDDNTITLG